MKGLSGLLKHPHHWSFVQSGLFPYSTAPAVRMKTGELNGPCQSKSPILATNYGVVTGVTITIILQKHIEATHTEAQC